MNFTFSLTRCAPVAAAMLPILVQARRASAASGDASTRVPLELPASRGDVPSRRPHVRTRSAVVVAAVVAVLLGGAAPARADDLNMFCAMETTGTLASGVSSVLLGDGVAFWWSVNAPCGNLSVLLTGPGGYYQPDPPSLVITAPTTSGTWTLSVIDNDNGGVYRLSSVSVTVALPVGSPIGAARNADGRLELFEASPAQQILHRSQTTPGGAMSSWGQFGGSLQSVAAQTNADGRVELFGLNASQEVWHSWQTAPGGGSWSDWVQLDGGLTSVAAARNADGRLEIFGSGTTGEVWHRRQVRPGSTDWTGWEQLDGALREVAAATNADGRVELFGTTASGTIFHRWQLSPGGAWSGWEQIDGLLTSIAAARNADGRLEIFGATGAQTVFHRSQVYPGGPLGGWVQLDGALTHVAAETNADGRVELFGTNVYASGTWHRTQASAGSSTWTPWATLDGAIAAAPVLSPGTNPLKPSASAVAVSWYDRSDNALGFQVLKRDGLGQWQPVYQVATRSTAGSGQGSQDYAWTDTNTGMSGQCYKIVAYNHDSAGATDELCTVRPDPAVFPQTVPQDMDQWTGLTRVNGSAGSLGNNNRTFYHYLTHQGQTFGTNLGWDGNASNWTVQAEGGPQLMHGQAVALHVPGGGWLKYGHQTYGVNLDQSDTPSYEWYVIGVKGTSNSTFAGVPLDTGVFALWNSAAQDYLIFGSQSVGVDLNWYKKTLPPPPPPPTPTTVTFELVKQPVGLATFIPYAASYPSFGSVPPFHLIGVQFPLFGAVDQTVFLVKPGHNTEQCGDPAAVIPLLEGQSLTSTQITTLWGSAQPHFSTQSPLAAVACWNGNGGYPSIVDLNITIQND